MPEIAFDKDDHPLAREDDVRPSRQARNMLSEPQASLMQLPSDHPLEGGIPSFDPGHAVTSLRLREVVGHFMNPDRTC